MDGDVCSQDTPRCNSVNLYEAAEVVDAQAREESRTDSSNSLCSRSPWLRSSCAGTH